MIKKNLLALIIMMFAVTQACAFELDWSADEEIRQKYEPSKLEQEVLPGLPSILNENPIPQSSSQKIQVQKTAEPQVSAPPKANIETDYSAGTRRVHTVKNDSYTAIRIKKGTKFKVKSSTKVSDWNTAGARMSFVSTAPVTQRYVSVPAGTTFKGEIVDSHQPNFFGNGGLMKIKSDAVVLNGSTRSIDAKVIKANDKKIFFNNIKGKRGYAKGLVKSVDRGQKFYSKSRRVSDKLRDNPITAVASPVPVIVGAAGYAVNLAVSPIVAIWSKGEHISIPSGANYVIKLKEHAYLY